MKKFVSLILLGLLLSGCIHKMDIEQGNIITQEEVSKLHRGMSETQVKNVMGTPMLMNIFSPNRIDYVYSFKAGHGDTKVTRVICTFEHGRLSEIIRQG